MDYKVTINHYLEIKKYPLPKPEDQFTTLYGGKIFSKIALLQTYQQMSLHKDNIHLIIIKTDCVSYINTISFSVRLPYPLHYSNVLWMSLLY